MTKLKTKNIVLISICILVLFSSPIIFPLVYADNWITRGQIGDTFNIISSFSTLIASIVGVGTLIIYGYQIIAHQKEMDFSAERQDEIEKNLSKISLTMSQITETSQKNLQIQSLLHIIDIKREQINTANLNNSKSTTIVNIEIELNSTLIQLEETLKTIYYVPTQQTTTN